MKQSNNITCTPNACLQANSELNDSEMEVAGILLELPQLMVIRNRLPLSWPSWGSKRRRSVEANSSLRRVRSLSPAPLPILPEIGALLSPAFTEKPAAKVEETCSSPATPLSFPLSESDEKPKNMKREASVMMSKEQVPRTEKGRTQANEFLREIDQARSDLMCLEPQHLRLQEREQQLILGIEKGKAYTAKPATSNTAEYQDPHHQQQQRVVDGRPWMMDQTGAMKLEKSESYEYPMCGPFYGTNGGLGMRNEKVEPRIVFDLNVTPQPETSPIWMEMSEEVDAQRLFTKAMAAQARYRRMLKCRNKNNTSTKLGLPRK